VEYGAFTFFDLLYHSWILLRHLGNDHLTSRGRYGFFLKKYSDSERCWKRYFHFGGGKKI